MRLTEFRRRMESYRRDFNEEAMSLKDSYLALDRLHAMYGQLDDYERAMADQVLAEWVLSDDENVRFDALALIDDFKIASASRALESLAKRLAASHGPGVPYELQKLKRIMVTLSTTGSESSKTD